MWRIQDHSDFVLAQPLRDARLVDGCDPSSQLAEHAAFCPGRVAAVICALTFFPLFIQHASAADDLAYDGGAGAPVRLIIDTDMSTDVDDVAALCMAHALADRGEVEIAAVVHNTGEIQVGLLHFASSVLLCRLSGLHSAYCVRCTSAGPGSLSRKPFGVPCLKPRIRITRSVTGCSSC